MQIDELILAELLFLSARRGCVVELNRANGCGGAIDLEEEEGTADCDLVAGSEKPLFDGDAINESAGGGFQVGEQEILILAGYLAVKSRNRGVVDTDEVGRVATYRQGRTEA